MHGRFVSEGRSLGGTFNDASRGASRFSRVLAQVGTQVGDIGAMGPAIGAGIVAAVGAVAVALPALVSAATFGLVAAAGIGISLSKPRIKLAFEEMTSEVKTNLQKAAEPFDDVMMDIAADIRQLSRDVGPQLRMLFATAAPMVRQLASALGPVVKNLLPGLQASLEGAQPFIAMLSEKLPVLASEFSGMLEDIAVAAGESAQAWGMFFDSMAAGFDLTGKAIQGLNIGIALVSGDLPGVIAMLSQIGETAKSGVWERAGEGADEFADGMNKVRDASQRAADAVRDVTKAAAGLTLDLAMAQTRAAESSAHLAAGLKTAAGEWRRSTEVGREHRTMLEGAARDAFALRDAAEATAKSQGRGATAAAEGTKALNNYTAGLRRTLQGAHLTDAQIDELFRSVGLLPAKKETRVAAPGATQSTGQVAALNAQIRAMRDKQVRATAVANWSQVRELQNAMARLYNRTVFINVKVRGPGSIGHEAMGLGGFAQGGLIGYPTGGMILGVGSGTSDSNLVAASRGEFMVRKSSVDRAGLAGLEFLNRTGRWPHAANTGPSRQVTVNVYNAPPASAEEQVTTWLRRQEALYGR
jgi:hypothetical protein